MVPENRHELVVELDEMWSFVQKKTLQAWIWIAYSRQSRQVLAYAVGDRTSETCRRLWDALPRAYQRARTFCDFWKASQEVWASNLEPVGKQSGQTSRLEHLNGTIRQRLGQFVRKSLSFSKCIKRHVTRLHLLLHRYNLERARSIILYGKPFHY
ncbi:MAG: IS1 family transposase [Chlamydiales bacterium]|nr:IS1 family transposase [Chlamydiales bacterium]